MNNKETFDEQLKEIAGGNYAEDFYYAVSKFGNNYKLIKKRDRYKHLSYLQ